ncbi:hypothetical protein PR202_gb22054 [Eleusine coracana subsp. coracana]|uniref:NAC domain-containing protein n=1 Tax=Eleusine coracana subsp. coracana TaxID=191504 RepID=A0AAV5FEP5_ELECO|nr:hypothetical protein QOZ80_7BG0613270 [Eleusine coracana subsp. coracana]GJN33452.1 hypothetical protein PR202_gb22054 [Eleusine coracana subsp. coracana]
MSEVSVINQLGEEDQEQQLELPPGFRFHPTDEEVITHYLTLKALNCLFTCLVIADVDLNKCEPWDLPNKAKMGEKEWYFFCHKDRKYPTGMRTNRATASGYWKATGKDKEIFRGRNVLVGMKKTLVFYLGRAPRGEKTPWVMHEYRLEGKLPPNLPRAAKDEWAVCRVFNKDLMAKQPAPSPSPVGPVMVRSDSIAFLEEFLNITDLPPLTDSPPFADDALIDLKGPSSSGSGAISAAGMPSSSYQVIKTEQQQNPTPPPLTMTQQQQVPNYTYFTMPATSNNPHQAGAGDNDHQLPAAAIRRHCPDMASSRPAPFPELEDLYPDGFPFTDYSNMWKC